MYYDTRNIVVTAFAPTSLLIGILAVYFGASRVMIGITNAIILGKNERVPMRLGGYGA